ncbi:carboxypeptidase regulatory-like domain-containing protein [Deinococcus aquiradiocola]|uniref:carboxypeptidase regulatory-like domain-containing protein n=1 Tax=Deinococcus aquiradiocola TaxID=393059 RepID=UPI00166682AD|nr:carboxypeptidase regulatory-like domain-containing protein [Deinococcus aquiradiocola]
MSIRSSRVLLLALSASLLAACNSGTSAPEVTLSGVLSLSRAGEAVAGATVKVGDTGPQTTTDASGHYTLNIPANSGAVALTFTKAGYASTRVENVDPASMPVVDEILQASLNPDLPSTPPTVTLDLADGATVGADDLKIQVKTTTASPDLNGPTSGIASLGVDAGSSGYLNAGRARAFVASLKGDDTFTLKASDIAAYSGNLDVHVAVYDFNGNRTHVIRHVKVAATSVAKAVVAPTDLSPTAITFADTATYGALGTSPLASSALKNFVKGDAATLKGLAVQRSGTLTPQAADSGTVMWVDVAFKYDPAAPLPRSFELYRSSDAQNYTRVLTATPAKVAQDDKGNYLIRDNSAQLTPGTRYTYRVRAVSDTATQDSAVTTVTPLGRYTITLGAPAQGSTGVETAPIFRWKTGGASDKEALLLLVLDRTQAEGKSFQWQSDVSGKTSAVYDNDGRALTPYLQPFHAYDWQMAGMTYNTDQTAFSIGADFFNALGIVSNPVKGGPVNEFVTGGY